MSVSVLTRPIGYSLNAAHKSISSVSSSAGTALFTTSASHGFSVGNFVYVKTNVENYNGFWRVASTPSGTTFTIEEYSGATDVQFIKTATGTATLGTSNAWSCVHLPIVYKLTNTLWPTNSNTSDDPIRTVSTCNSVSSGYCELTLSGSIKTVTISALNYVKITGTTDFDGVYQIINYTSNSIFQIDLPYSSDADTQITGASIQFYYNNYCINVQVWGGLDNGHTYYSQEPYELLATLKLIPDENNQVKFSISDILKQNIEISNNLLLGTLPNNLDAFTKFFIKYGYSNDDSDGTTLETETSSYTSDLSTFEGYAVNAMLPFKNVFSGGLAEYSTGDSTQKFLTVFERPVLFTCPEAYSECYQDISAILEESAGTTIVLNERYYLNGSVVTTETTNITSVSPGVYRIPLSQPAATADRVDVWLTVSSTPITETKRFDIESACSSDNLILSFLNYLGGFDYWHFTAYKDYPVEIVDSGETETNVFPSWPDSYGEFADTIRKQTFRTSREQIVVRSQNLTLEQVKALKYIRTSPLVQIVNSIYDKRTVIVDKDSFVSYKEGQVQQGEQYTVSFTITYTDDVPSQRV